MYKSFNLDWHNRLDLVLGLNSGKSVQIAIERRPDETILHVNNHNSSVPVGVGLLTEYSNKPWNNSDSGNLKIQHLIPLF